VVGGGLFGWRDAPSWTGLDAGFIGRLTMDCFPRYMDLFFPGLELACICYISFVGGDLMQVGCSFLQCSTQCHFLSK